NGGDSTSLQVAKGVGKGLLGLAVGGYKLMTGQWVVDLGESLYHNVKEHGAFVGINLTLNPVTQAVAAVKGISEAFEAGDYETVAENVTTVVGGAILTRGLRGNPALGKIPYGFKSFGQFRQFSQAARGTLNRLGYKNAEPI